MKNKKLVIVGAGEFALLAYEYFTYDSEFEVVAFSVHEQYIEDAKINGKPVVPFEILQDHFSPEEHYAFVAIPATKLNRVRTQLFSEAKEKGYPLATYISSHAFVWRNAEIGENCFIFEDNTIQPFVTIEDNVILWSGNHVGHRTVIRANSFITSHSVISGYCDIGESSFVGVNSTFNDKTSLASRCIVGSGAVVTKALRKEETIYVGNPAKPLPKKSALDVEL
jgi:sugar O-acyltransferase (sialic acid O-acetyltransferase NeuD family)